ncbi:hypothetical protein VYU27_009682, partial [Nannochloropsis oceanica]
IFIAPSTYASTYFELCSLVPSEEEIRRQLHRMTELAGVNVRVTVLRKGGKEGRRDGAGGFVGGRGGGGGGGGGVGHHHTADVLRDGGEGGKEGRSFMERLHA